MKFGGEKKYTISKEARLRGEMERMSKHLVVNGIRKEAEQFMKDHQTITKVMNLLASGMNTLDISRKLRMKLERVNVIVVGERNKAEIWVKSTNLESELHVRLQQNKEKHL